MSPLDRRNLATSRWIKQRTKLTIDNIPQLDPLIQAARTQPWGYDPEEDDFRDWAMQVRKDAGIVDPPEASGGGRSFKVLGPEGLTPEDFDADKP